jgi:DNA-directed RNA polymerase specialized sigma24 family protein
VATVDDFDKFAADAGERLRRAFAGPLGVDGAADATAEALSWAWENRTKLASMENPVGYLYRVGRSRTRYRSAPGCLPSPVELGVPEVEPGLVPALLALTERQRTAVWLVHGCQWRHREVADAMGISATAVATHVQRALAHLRARLEGTHVGCD